jgi:hypothetical protein
MRLYLRTRFLRRRWIIGSHIIARKLWGSYSNLVLIRKYYFSQPIVCSAMLRRL